MIFGSGIPVRCIRYHKPSKMLVEDSQGIPLSLGTGGIRMKKDARPWTESERIEMLQGPDSIHSCIGLRFEVLIVRSS